MEGAIEKLKGLLCTLFQFDCADLDFGIYRIMNYKRGVIERFIEKDLIEAVSAELDSGILAQQNRVAAELQRVARQMRESFGEDALDGDGRLAEAFHNTPLGRQYLDLQTRAAGAKDRDALEVSIFNHLYTFFSRYYDNGDFISKRRYSKQEKYAIPYNGEEVYLYWANSDQYYIKTAEYFRDYRFQAPNGVAVHFRLREARVEKDNNKGDKRFFFPRSEESSFDPQAKEIVIPFEFRLLTEQEKVKYGTRNHVQDAIIAEALKEIPGQFEKSYDALGALTAERHRTADGKSVSCLEHHLRQYTRRNTSDFFIHKDLKGFLTRELDFYLKNEVLSLDELEAAGETLAQGWFQVMQVIRAIGARIITFLAQIEDFQKKLFEKKKFVTETQYCITMDNIKKEFYKEIAANDAQWAEWKDLFHIDEEEQNLFTAALKTREEKRVAFLAAHPTLVLDTGHFDAGFVDRLLASFEDLDEQTDGLLIHGENFQALSLLLEKYSSRVKAVHIDPPYNTQTSGFLYKNEYQHSTWLAMMSDRIAAAIPLMSPEGAFLCHIDENEYEALYLLFSRIGIPDGGTIVWDKKNPMLGRKGVATQHEYVLWRTWNKSSIYLRPTNVRRILAKARSLIRQYGGVNDTVRREFVEWISGCDGLTGGERAYRFIDDQGRVFQSVAIGAPEPRTDPKFHIPLIHPVTKKECPVPSNGWSRAPETIQQLIEENRILFGKDETVQPRLKVFLTDESKRQLSSVLSDPQRGKADIEKLGLEFPYCHPVSLYEELLGAAADGGIVLDYFAGSGTTGHAVIDLNREDGGKRKFILVEMDNYFDTVLLPRIKKVTFTPEWRDGKPARMPTPEEAAQSPRIIKYIRLESYDDALNNISFTPPAGQRVLEFDDYLLKYMLDWETKESETFLNVQKLARPFSYELILTESQETKKKPVDIPETFNFLLGLHVSRRQVYQDGDRRYVVCRGTVENKRAVVIWRETEGWSQEDYERDKKFVAGQKLTGGADEVYVNGDSFIPGARSLDPVFKSRMFGGV